MNFEFPRTRSGIFRFIALTVCFLFSVVSGVVFIFIGTPTQALMCLVAAVCTLIPEFLERVLKVRVSTPLYVFVLLYSLGPMLGHTYHFYHIIEWWDTLLHVCGGVAFAILGAYLPRLFDKNHVPSVWLSALFGLFFSIAVSGLWELFEFGVDVLFKTDMQNDTFITSLNSYLLGSEMGVVGSIPNIESVIVNGQPLQGYIDIGLIDTMKDMFVETMGALVYVIVFIVTKGTIGLKDVNEPEPIAEAEI